MRFIDEVKAHSKKCVERIGHLDSEEATKNSLVLPFIKMLGYDYHDPTEVIPEYTADVGLKRGEKVDYALICSGKPAILVECKAYGSTLNTGSVSQLLRYFTTTDTRFGVLTDGITYWFFSDLDQRYKMDSKPFFEFNMLQFTESQVEELKQFTKSKFGEAKIVERAYRLKYIKEIKNRLAQERIDPTDDFVRFIMKPIYAGSLTKKVVEELHPVMRDAFGEFVNEQVAARRNSAPDQTEPPGPVPIGPKPAVDPGPPPSTGDWTPLSQISDVTNRKPPTTIEFNNDETQLISSWTEVLLRVVEWLVRNGHLSKEDLPIDGSGSGFAFINSDSSSPNGNPYRSPQHISGGIFLETSYSLRTLSITARSYLPATPLIRKPSN